MHPQLGAPDHQGITHIVAGVAHINQTDIFQMPEMFTDRQHIGQNLGGMVLVCQPVPHGNARIFCQFLHDLLPVSAVLNTVKHPSQHSGSVRYTFLFSNLRTGRIQVSGSHTQIVGRHLKRTAGAGAGLLKNQRDIFSPQGVHRNTPSLLFLQLRRQIQKTDDLIRCKILKCQKVPAF
mgnify:CR=1 FL=1